MVKLTIDGQPVEVPAGTLLIEACRRIGKMPPHFCYHPGLPPDGNCRMCLVKVQGFRTLATACTLPVAEGMVVSTEDPEVLDNRRSVMEFLLIHHPLDCPVCDKAGECILQDYSFEHGSGKSRYVEEKIVRPKRDLGERIALWPERCIRCSRCVRFLDHVTGTSELTFVDRGDRTDLTIFPGRPIDNPLSLNVVDICPVGALISKDFLFQARVWNTKQADTVCPACSRGCNITADAYEGRVVRIRPRLNEAVNGHWMCDYGRLSYGYLHAPERPRSAWKQADGTRRPVSLAEAAEIVKLNAEVVGSEGIAALVTPWLTNEELELARELFQETWRIRHLACVAAPPGPAYAAPNGFRISSDRNPNRVGLRAVLGLEEDREAVERLATAIEDGAVRMLYVLGGSPEPAYPEELVAVAGKLECLVVQDLVPSPLLDKAHLVLPAAGFVEKQGTYVNDEGRVQRLRPLLAPPLPGGDLGILAAVLRALGVKPPGGGVPRGVFRALAERLPAFRGLTYEGLGRTGAPLTEPAGLVAPAPAREHRVEASES